MKRSQTTLAAGFALVLGTGAAYAGSVTFDTDTWAGGTTIPFTTPDWDTGSPPPNPMLLPQFNDGLPGVSSGATLTAITIDWEGGANLQYQIENIDVSATSSGSNELLVDLGISAPAAYSDSVNLTSGVIGINLATFDGSIDFMGPSGQDTGTLMDSGMGSFMIGAGDFGAYTGGGNFELNGAADGDSDRQITGGELLEGTTWRAGLAASVTYEFEEQAVPVPAPIALLSLGLVGLAAVRRRAK